MAAALLAGAGAVLALGVLSVQRLTPDAASAGDADVRPTSAAPGPDDAYPDFIAIAAKLQLTPEERALLGKLDESAEPDLAAAEPLIERNAEALALFAAFSRRARFADPNYVDLDKVGHETPVPQFFPLVSAARLGSLRAKGLLLRGRAPEALEEALGILEAGKVMLRSDQPIIAALVGILLQEIGTRRAREAVESGKLDKARLLEAARRLAAHRGGAPALQAGLRFEYLMTAHMLDHLPEYSAKSPGDRWYNAVAARSLYFYQPRRTKAMFAARFRGLIEEAAKPCHQARPPSHEPAPVDARPNVLGRVLFNEAFPQYEKLYVRRCTQDFRVAALAASAAIEAYRLDHKRRPAALEDLVPGYLPAAPLDPFTGGLLLYSPDTGRVGSADKDLDGNPP